MRTVPLVAMLMMALSGAGCRRSPRTVEEGTARVAAVAPRRPPAAGVAPGIDAAALIGGRRDPYTGNAGAIQQGRQLFNAFNCSGCHSGYAGGGMGPNLRDTVWIYGSTDADLFSTISEGRPNGMPAWGGRIPEDQIWRIIAYLRTFGTAQEPEKPPTPTRTTRSAIGGKEAA